MEADHPTIGEYTLTCKLGGGSSSTVWKAEHRTTGKVVALKQIDLLKLTRQLKNCLDCELNFLSSVEHPNIIRLFDVFQAENSIFLVLEFCAGGDLAAYIRDHGRVQECVARKFMKQIGAGLEVLSMHHILHRDLKPENILLSTMETDPILKIADFGLSRMLNPNDLAETVCGSPFYMAPEILEFKKYDDKVRTIYCTTMLHRLDKLTCILLNRLICGVSVQFFLNYLMVTLPFVVELVFRYCGISRHLYVFLSLSRFFLSCTRVVLTCAQDYCLLIQRNGSLLKSFVDTTF
ncbi:serine/threonine-protein kinase ATG1t isoform X2 [Solanum tuberosum]|uniref:serine/threonine-protein kinase ATG1t isoform X2 n=1 Tax=Solanum tuberosum TaxID=4113 RepID=UPI00073A19B2|nr:PREDICTED: serine/threonine-protein kinase ATG1t isoform X2 [Solanum tuberosum]